jgi:carbamoyltransferase
MRILGINHDMYISSAAIIEDGKIIAACTEERLTREKRTRKFPINAIKFCLSEAKCTFKDIDHIANSYNPSIHMEKYNPIYSSNRRFRGDYLYHVPDNLFRLTDGEVGNSKYTRQIIDYGEKELDLYFVTHHLCHAANGFYLSPFSEAAVFTSDGRGEKDTTVFMHGKNNKLNTIKSIKIPHSLGSFYSTFTEYLGFKPDSDEWKVMALSSFTESNNEYYQKLKETIFLLEDGTFRLDTSYYNEYIHELPSLLTEKLIQLVGKPRKKSEEILPKHYKIASAMQRITEETLAHMLNWLHDQTGSDNIVLSGGTFMNSVFNGKIKNLTKFKNIFISDSPDDSGLSIGAALYLYHDIKNKNEKMKNIHNYLGPSYSNDSIKEILEKYRISYNYVDNIEKETAKLLSEGNLIAWFQDKMEFGQRALGNRSILADPRNESTKDHVNKSIKYRESFRPFAPAILDEYKTEFFEMDKNEDVMYMEKVYPIKAEKRKLIPAVTHVDGTGRLQTVKLSTNEKFYKLIDYFYQLTGIPVLLNTSFNLNGEPICCSPTDAIRTFFSSGLDVLVLNNFIIKK